ncbi:MAG TPA: kynurenine 3-monooxygenase [Xanthomonadaceae bacterium]|jgi:kynurenine 3-monooxygenase|nr:kynurenine 3-monooxygenase [Xanthomonadaceae bacterium]
MSPPRHLIIGGGLAGALLAVLLARRGHRVDVFERRADQRVRGYEGGRSINLALARRGLAVLQDAGLGEAVLQRAVPMRGRQVHPLDGEPSFLPYSRNDAECIWSVHRGRLNHLLLDAAEAAGARVHFHHRLGLVDFDARRAEIIDERDRRVRWIDFDALLGADGAGSALRNAMQGHADLHPEIAPLDHGYKELEIPPLPGGGFRIEREALHIWPRGGYMLIALPNTEGTFTVTLFLPHKGRMPNFEDIETAAQARAFFQQAFPDALALMPAFEEGWIGHPTSSLATLRLRHWHLDHRAVLVGDAAHAMVPFHGQGMNCAFEDVAALDRLLVAHDDRAEAFAAFEAERKPNAEAIQTMALENYVEMRTSVDDAQWRLQRALELCLAERHPGRFVPRYSMVSFTRTPYALAFERGQWQRALLVDATRGIDDLAQVDLATVDARIIAELAPLAAESPEPPL